MTNEERFAVQMSPWIGLTAEEAESKAREEERPIVLRQISQYENDSIESLPPKTVIPYLSPEGRVQEVRVVPVVRI